ncbi:MAG TPA: DUF1269 domain-containing protein [Dongiaceae bacterium]|nr:DUF1269 domain-containing protein [Dongiaceae bacterium]
MERMLAVIFENETKAYEGSRALKELDQDGSIAIHAESVIQKNADGTVSMKQVDGDFPIRAVAGTGIGSLIGVLGGPVGLAVGAAIGASVGMLRDAYLADVNVDFLDDVATSLKPGKTAVLADVSEEWVTPVDSRMEALGGTVLRTEREHFEEERRTKELAALRVEIAELKAEHAHARAERKAKIQAKIDALNQKLQNKVDEAKQRSEALKKETDAKINALQEKAAKAQREAKATINARIAEIKKEHEERSAKLRAAMAAQLRKAAAHIEKGS